MKSLKAYGIEKLQYLGKYTKIDMVYLAGGGLWLGLGQIIATGSAFFISLAFANLISPDSFGTYKYVLSITSLMGIATLSGMDSAITQSVARGFDGTLVPGFKEKMKWGFGGMIFSFALAVYYFIGDNNTLGISFIVVGLFLPFIDSLDIYNSLLWGKKLFKTQVSYNTIKKVIGLASVVLTLFITKNILIIITVYFLSALIPNIFFFLKAKKLYISNNEIDASTIKYGKNLSFIYVISLILSEIDKILVFHYVGAANLAVYSLALAPNDQIKGLFKNINSLAMPIFSSKSKSEVRQNLWHKIKFLALATTIIVVCYFFAAPYFFSFFFPKYLESIKFSQILSISLIPVIISGFIYTILESQKAEKEIYYYNVYTNVFGIIILLPLVYYYGIWGAIISKVITRFFSFAFVSFQINRMTE